MQKPEDLFRPALSALCAAFALCAASAFAAMPDEEFAKLCFSGTAAQVKQALAEGANPNARAKDGYSALHRAVQDGADKVRALLAVGADVNARVERGGITVLMDAAQSDNVEAVAQLLAAGADVNAQDTSGQTALFWHVMRYQGDARITEALLRAGAALNAQDKNGITPLMYAASFGRDWAVRALLSAGADATLRDAHGKDALAHARDPYEEARREGAAACVKLLQSAAQKPAQAKPQEAGKVAAAPEKTHTNSIGMEFVLIAAGTFQMGCSSEAEDCAGDEKPRHEVTISKPYYLGKHEVTQAQWEAVMGSNPSKFKGANRPVENVTWLDAQAFIKKLNAKEGHGRYRLPTEAEWEYAARAGSTTAYGFGDDVGQLGEYAWYQDNVGRETHPVGGKRANAWGLHDMHGNVGELVHDWYGKSYASAAAVTDPQGPGAGEGRVLRGGSWFSGARRVRSAMRGRLAPDKRLDNVGFRLALTPQQ